MPLNPQVASLLAALADASPLDLATTTPDAMRAVNDQPMYQGPEIVSARAGAALRRDLA